MHEAAPCETTPAQNIARGALSTFLATTGVAHMTFARRPYKAQVPEWLPLDPAVVVALSGVPELLLSGGLLCLPRQRKAVGWLAAAFFVAILPGNISQYTQHRSAFGLDTDRKRFLRLFIQPVLVGWALWSTGAVGRGRRAR